MSQLSARLMWEADELQRLLVEIMGGIHERGVEYGRLDGARFVKVADAMPAFGVV